jgi:hypothetical protein
MAIIAKGQVLRTGEPLQAIDDLASRIWKKIIDKSALEQYQRDLDVISTRLISGRTVIHVYSEGSPGEGFEPVEASLEDVYFSTLSQANAEKAAA